MSAALLSDYARIFLCDLPLLDVRAPVEFAAGALPQAVNVPLLTDDERRQVGTCYKQHGQQAAVALGHRLVGGDVKAARVQAWVEFAQRHPEGALYCARGGLRSQTVQQWLAEAGVDYPRVAGGFKALRNFLLGALNACAASEDLVVLGGWTGSGKTELLRTLPQGLDLEGCARHRGSSFGALPASQPAQIDFENCVAVALLKKQAAGARRLVVEDEGNHIGRCEVPLPLRQAMSCAPVVWLEESFDARVQRLVQDYTVDLCAAYLARWAGADGFARYAEHLQHSLAKIRKRLGGERHQRLLKEMQSALAEQDSTGSVARHRDWIAALLREYYDPMYAYQRSRLSTRIAFAGERDAVRAYLSEIAAPSMRSL